MSGGICDKIKFQTLENTSKYYWKDKVSKIDYPSSMIGTKTPSRFLWSKMEHMVNVMDQAVTKTAGKSIVDGSGKEFTAIEFLVEIASTKMWMFEFSLEL